VKVAYLDPVYLGCGRLYPEHPDSKIWDDQETHRALIDSAVELCPDGWALSLSVPSLRVILPMCPTDVRIGSWVKTFCAFKKGVRPCYAWEPVIFWRGRNKNPPVPEKGGKQVTPKDFLLDDTQEDADMADLVEELYRGSPSVLRGGFDAPDSPAFAGPITLKKGLTGAKSEKFCDWVLDLLNVQAGDEVVDLFPGTGVMGRVAAARGCV
jgi:hypothetical protein